MASLPNFLNTLLNNPAASTFTDGLKSAASNVLTPYGNQVGVRSSSRTKPINPMGVITPLIIRELTPTSKELKSLRIPSQYQSVVKSTVATAIKTVLSNVKITLPQQRGVEKGSIDIGTQQFTGIVSTKLFAETRASLMSTDFGKSGQLSNAMCTMADSAITIGKSEAFAKYGSSILTNQQYDDFTKSAVSGFTKAFDESPINTSARDVLQKTLSNTALDSQNIVASMLPPLPNLGISSLSPLSKLNPLSPAQVPDQISAFPNSQSDSSSAGPPAEHTRKVYLISAISASDMFLFKAQPVIQVAENANYSAFSPIHAPSEILAFKNNPSRTFSLSEIKLISRTPEDAQTNLTQLHLLRAWTKPYFGRAQLNKTGSGDTSSSGVTVPEISGDDVSNILPATESAAADLTSKITNAQDAVSCLRSSAQNLPSTLSVLQADVARYTPDPFNQTLISTNPLPNLTASLSTTQAISDAKANVPSPSALTSKLGSGSSSAAFAAIDPRRVDIPTAGGGRGGQGGPTAAEFNAAQLVPIVPTAESALNASSKDITNSIGSPPEILYLYGYSDDGNSTAKTVQNLRRIPVVIESLSYTYPNDVDYIPTKEGIPFPTVMTLSITLKETQSPYEMEQFSLADFKQGKLIGW